MMPNRIQLPDTHLLISGNKSLGSQEGGLYEKTEEAIESITSNCFEIVENNQLLIAGNKTLGVQPAGIYKRIA